MHKRFFKEQDAETWEDNVTSIIVQETQHSLTAIA